MVNGLTMFRGAFRSYADQFVVIGGTAASLVMDDAGLEFRATKDVDIVLHVEALTPAFGAAFWRFVNAGGYEIRQSATGKPVFYRFQKPTTEAYPAMLELFARAPESLHGIDATRCTPIPFDQVVSSLSAILLDDDYYAFVIAGRRTVDGLPVIGADRLIPLKAAAWLDLVDRKARGAAIDGKDIRKHANDVLRLSQLLAEAVRIDAPQKIANDLARFIEQARVDASLNAKALGLKASTHDILDRVRLAYGLST